MENNLSECYDCLFLSCEELFNLYEKENTSYLRDRIYSIINNADDTTLTQRAIRLIKMKDMLMHRLKSIDQNKPINILKLNTDP